nr:MAG TPA: hypothetical protein [Bacteriophage sp.]
MRLSLKDNRNPGVHWFGIREHKGGCVIVG